MTKPEWPWRPMSEAPRDGTMFLVMYEDYSGAELMCWGDYYDLSNYWLIYNGNGTWGEHSSADEILEGYGWMPVPKVIADDIWQQYDANAEERAKQEWAKLHHSLRLIHAADFKQAIRPPGRHGEPASDKQRRK